MGEGDGNSSGQGVFTFLNPAVPYAADIPGGVFPGKAILIKGVVTDGNVNGTSSSKSSRFNVDLCCGKLIDGDHKDNRALHFNARFVSSGNWFSRPDRDIVINSLINNTWGPEQRCANVFAVGQPFSIRILVLKDYIKIAVNGRHLCDYIHRVSIDTIKCLYVDGCVQLSLLEFQGNISSESPSPTAPPQASFNDFDEPISITKPDVPFVQDIYGGFMPPREIHVVFTPRMSARQIAFNLFADTEYLLHVRIDFPASTADKRGAIVRNSTRNGDWLTEERRLVTFPFLPGITSDIRFVADTDHAKIFIDGLLLDNFTYRTDDERCPRPNRVDRFTTIGDLSIQRFEMRNRDEEVCDTTTRPNT